ncbi:hypothetical protein Ancab_016374 [Ancistrocladus abbreviatus]
MNHKLIGISPPSVFCGGGDGMKRSPSELALEEFLREPIKSCNKMNDENNNSNSSWISKDQQRGINDASALVGVGDSNRKNFNGVFVGGRGDFNFEWECVCVEKKVMFA